MTSAAAPPTLPRMDTLKILLGATLALVLGLLITFATGMRDGVRGASKEDLSKMRQQLFEIEQEMDRLRVEKERKLLREAAETPASSDVVTREEAEADREALEARLKQLEAEATEARMDAERAEEEALLLNQKTAEGRDNEARRARLINDAMLIARIAHWQEDPNLGDFAILEVVSSENVQVGSELSIRRNGGVLGNLRISEITPEGAIANPVTRFNEVKPQPGDELILKEVVDLAP